MLLLILSANKHFEYKYLLKFKNKGEGERAYVGFYSQKAYVALIH